MLKAPETKRLKLKYDALLSSCVFNYNLHHYIEADGSFVCFGHEARQGLPVCS